MGIAALEVSLCVSWQATWQYELFAVVAHSGSASCGHYCAYIRSLTDCKWYCFNDSEVCQVSTSSHLLFVPSWTPLQLSSSLTGADEREPGKETEAGELCPPLLQDALR